MTVSPNILVAYKKSRYEQFVMQEQDQTVAELIEGGHISVRSLLSSHQAHGKSLELVVGHLESTGLSFDLQFRGDVNSVEGYDLVIALGGDGTVLDLSHSMSTTKMVSINSDPLSSVGYFSAGTAHDFPKILEEILKDKVEPTMLRRFGLLLDGQRLGPPVLNDLLICHANPAAVSSYFLKVGSHPAESQKSSGIWVSTPAGSTAGIRSAGGLVIPFGTDNLQYLVREPYPPREGGYRFLKGIHPFGEHFEVISRMREGRIFLDGPHLEFLFPLGSTLTLDVDVPSLALFGLQEDRRTA